MESKAFAARLTRALDDHPASPVGHGKGAWLKGALASMGVGVSHQAVRKWLNGESIPRQDKITSIAELLRVDVTWLALGSQSVPNKWKNRAEELEGAMMRIYGMTDDQNIHRVVREALGLSDL